MPDLIPVTRAIVAIATRYIASRPVVWLNWVISPVACKRPLAGRCRWTGDGEVMPLQPFGLMG